MAAGKNPEVSDGIRLTLPSTHELDLYHDMTLVGTEVGSINLEVRRLSVHRDLAGRRFSVRVS